MTALQMVLTDTTSGTTGSALVSMLLPFVVLIVVFYFLLIRPENKKKKALSEMRNALAVGDEVTTIGGIVGKVVHIKDDLVTIETSEDRVRIQFTRWAISTKGTQTTENQ
jgi:preprotein translocase subunit YajC